jgi:hypothetical protein
VSGQVINAGKSTIFSSLWSGLKSYCSHILDNCTWQLGIGNKINFWLDSWCGKPVATTLQIPNAIHGTLKNKVQEFIVNYQWSIPPKLLNAYPQLIQHVQSITIPLDLQEDRLLWNSSNCGIVSLKDAYQFIAPPDQNLPWTKNVWCKDIPPSKSLFIWRLFHDKVPTDDNLLSSGCSLASVCSLCFNHIETTSHLFFECTYAAKVWTWFYNLINMVPSFQSLLDLFSVSDRGWNLQCSLVINFAIVQIINAIWFARNQARFKDIDVPWRIDKHPSKRF